MELTPGEKIMITMLADIKNHFKIKGEIDHDFVTKSIFHDSLWALDWRMPGLNFPREENPAHVKEVVSILSMFDVLERSFDRLSQGDKDAIENDPSLSSPRFAGFDGNNETEHMGAAIVLVRDLNRFTDYADRDFNSHYPTLDRYLAMVEVFEAKGQGWLDRHPAGLTKDEIIEILRR